MLKGGTAGFLTFKFKPREDLLAGEKHLFERDMLDSLMERLEGTDARFSTKINEKVENPPLPYNLTVLLSDMSRRYGFPAAKTQQITQDLRDKYKAITYNRSDSQYLKEEHFTQAPEVLAQAMRNLGVSWELDYTIHSKVFNEKNVTAHHGIIPQEADAPVDRMTPDEAKVYTAIVERYAMQFLPPAVYDVSTSSFAVDEGSFTATCRRLRDAGFKSTFGHSVEEEKEDDKGGTRVDAGEHVAERLKCRVAEKETAPPKPYTEGTLIADMASIAKYVRDPEVKAILKQKDDGKKGEHGGHRHHATRAAILEKLKERGYLEEVKGKLRSTPKARAFYHLLPPEIAGADVTARWWVIQQDVAEGKADPNDLERSVVEVFRGHQDTGLRRRAHRSRAPRGRQMPALRAGRGESRERLHLLLEQEREAGGRHVGAGGGLRVQALRLLWEEANREAGLRPALRQAGAAQGLQVQGGQDLRLQGTLEEGRLARTNLREQAEGQKEVTDHDGLRALPARMDD